MIKERKVLVTGSSDGIGRSITLSLLKSGAKVIGLARDHSKFNPEMKNYIKYKTDFSNEEILLNTIAKIINEHKDLDCLVSNAGFGKFGTLETFSTKEIKGINDQRKKEIKVWNIICISTFEDKVGVAVGVSKDLITKYDAVNLVKIASEILGGKGGGGRKDFAQAGGVEKDKVGKAFKEILKTIN